MYLYLLNSTCRRVKRTSRSLLHSNLVVVVRIRRNGHCSTKEVKLKLDELRTEKSMLFSISLS